jgi:hypothetical protein
MFCAKCGEEITMPVWINRKPYGWSCAEKVQPGVKKPKEKYIECTNDIKDIRYTTNGFTKIIINVCDEKGKSFLLQVMAAEVDGKYYISEESLISYKTINYKQRKDKQYVLRSLSC